MNHRFIVYRQDGLKIGPIVVVTAETSHRISTDALLVAEIKKSVNKWVAETDEGKNVYALAYDDMNIGDLAGYADEIVANSTLIRSLSFESLDVAENWNFDTSLCDEIEEDEYAWIRKLHSGDQVTYNDPDDDGVPLKTITIKNIEIVGDRVRILVSEGGTIECHMKELS